MDKSKQTTPRITTNKPITDTEASLSSYTGEWIRASKPHHVLNLQQIRQSPTLQYVCGKPSISDYCNRYIRDNNLDQFPRPAEGFLVRAELKKTPDKGIGVFTCEFIPANTIVSDCASTVYFNEEQTRAVLSSLPSDDVRRYWLEHTWGERGQVAYILNDISMVNHSKNPTVYSNSEDIHKCYASRDILAGEELTEDYRAFDIVHFQIALYDEFGIDEDYLKD